MKKVALITGASSGIGKESAKLMAANGFTIYATARRIERMKDIEGPDIHLIKMDVTDDTSMQDCVAEIIRREGHIDILVNNAGYGSYGALEDVPISEARYQFEVNVFGLAKLIQLVTPHMRAQHGGRIINVSSMGGRFGEPHGSWYHATKFAVEGLSDSLRMELKQFGIDVVVIQPGAIVTEWAAIARENLLKVSGQTAYAGLVKKHAAMLESADKQGSDPIVIAKVIKKAATARRPKTRYVAGAGAKVILLLKKLLPDKWFDSVLLSLMKRAAK